MRKAIWIVITLTTLILCCQQLNKQSITIFHAGSLSMPLKELSNEFKKKYNVDVKLESSGSVMAIRKITDLGKKADIIAVADYTLLRDLYPEYVDFYIAFAKNEIVLCYTDKSRYSDEINANNWYNILNEKDVRFGFSNPNIDPCGYRTLMALKLADDYYGKNIFEKLIINHTNIKSNGSLIVVPKNVKTDGKIVLRDKSVDLVALLESGCIDYAFEYKSVALQHKLKFVELPDEIDLGNISIDYNVSVLIWKGGDKLVQEAEPIIYGVTILKNSENRELAEKFLDLMLGEEGREIFKKNYQEFLERPIGYGNLPKLLER